MEGKKEKKRKGTTNPPQLINIHCFLVAYAEMCVNLFIASILCPFYDQGYTSSKYLGNDTFLNWGQVPSHWEIYPWGGVRGSKAGRRVKHFVEEFQRRKMRLYVLEELLWLALCTAWMEESNHRGMWDGRRLALLPKKPEVGRTWPEWCSHSNGVRWTDKEAPRISKQQAWE